MSLTSYESDIKRINADEVSVFTLLSDLSRLEALKDKLPTDKVKEAYFDVDSVRLKVDMLGEVGMRIILREPYKTIKFQAENSP